jgi:hypothetical protein
MRNGRRRSGTTRNARPEAEANASGGGPLGWVRKHIVGGVIGAALVASLTAWLGGFLGSATGDLLPSGPDAFCALSETVRASWPFGRKPSADKFTILIATIDGGDDSHTYTYAVERAFSGRKGIEQIDTCRVLRIAGFSQEASAKTVAAAQHWLQQRRADLLIGGRLLKKDDSVDLWFTKQAACEWAMDEFVARG